MTFRLFYRLILGLFVVGFMLASVAPRTGVATSGTPTAQSSNAGIDLGFEAPKGISLVTLAGGAIDAAPSAPAHFMIERLMVAPGKTQAVRGDGQEIVVIYVETDGLTFIDASGLEAPTTAGTQIVLPPNIQYTARNDGPQPATFLRLSLSPIGAATDQTGTPPVGQVSVPIELGLEDIKFSTDTLEIPANTPTTIHITNTGATAHNFSIDALNISTGNVAPGASVDVTINAPAGTYTYYCNVPGHEAAGMKGTLTVTAAVSTPIPTSTPAPTETATGASDSSTDQTLLDAQVDKLPNGPATVFLARATFQPASATGGAVLSGPLGLIGEAGSLTIKRAGLLPAVLPKGKGVTLPAGTNVQLTNTGKEPAVVLVGGLIAAGSQPFAAKEHRAAPGTPTETSSSQPTSGPSASGSAPPSGQTVTIPNQWSFAVTTVQSVSAIISFETLKARGVFVVVTLNVTNLSNTPAKLPYDDFRLIDGKNRTFETNASANIDIAVSNGLSIFDNLQPSLPYEITLVFDIPADATDLTLTSSQAAFSIPLNTPIPSPDMNVK